jgi:hypothetical protein
MKIVLVLFKVEDHEAEHYGGVEDEPQTATWNGFLEVSVEAILN